MSFCQHTLRVEEALTVMLSLTMSSSGHKICVTHSALGAVQVVASMLSGLVGSGDFEVYSSTRGKVR